jgi:autotransporter translocation and assembly factor TamB
LSAGEEQDPKGTEPLGAKVRRRALWVVIVLLAIVSSTTYHLKTHEGGRALAGQLTALLNETFAGTVEVGHIEAMGVDEVEILDVRISSAAGEVLATIARIHLRVDAGTLGSSHVLVREVDVESAHLSLRREGEELALVAALRPVTPTRGDAERDVTIDRYSLVDSELVDLPEGLSLHSLDVSGDARTAPAPRLVIASIGGEVRRGGEPLARFDETRATLAAEGESEAELRLVHDASFVELRGSLTRRDERIDSFRGDASFDLEEDLLERAWASDAALVLGTKIEGRLSIEGGDDVLDGHLEVDTDGGALVVDATRDAEGFEVRASTEALALAEVLDGVELDPIGGEVVARIGNDVPRALEIEARDVRYGENVVPEAILTAELGDGYVEIERIAVPAWTGEEGELSVAGRIGFDRTADLTVRADLPGLAADDNVQRRAPGLDGRLVADLALSLTAGDEPTIDVEGRLAVRSAVLGRARVAMLEVEGSARGEAKRPTVDLHIAGRRITSESLSLRSIRAALTGGPETYALRGGAQLSSGREVEVALDGARQGEGLDVEGRATLSGVLAAPVVFAISALRFADDRTIALGELTTSGAGIDARASGTYRPEGASELEVDLRSLDLGAATGSRLTRGTGRATLRASGTLERPEMELDATLEHAALGPLSSPEVKLTAGISAADRSTRVELRGDFEGYGRLALDARGRLGSGPTLERRIQRTDWRGSLELAGVPLTLAMLLSPDLPPWDGVVDAQARFEGLLPTPNAHVEAEVRGFAALGSDPVDANVRFDFEEPHADAVVSLRDERGALATLSGRARVEPAALRPPVDRRHIARSSSWSLSFSMPRRRIDRLPRPLRREVALSAAVDGEVSRALGSTPSGEARIVLTRYDETGDGERCRHGGLATVGIDVDVGSRTTVRFATNTTGRASFEGEVHAETPLDTWLAEGLPERPPPVAFSARAQGLDLATIPVLCERASGNIDVEARGTALLTDHPRARLSVRSSDLRVGELDPFAASLNASTNDGRIAARIGITSGPHRGRLRIGAPLRFDGFVPQKPRRLTVEQLVYRNGGGTAELTGTARLGERLSGGVILDGRIHRLPIAREGEPAGRLNARAHVEASYGSEERTLLARFTETSFVMPSRPPLSRAERRRQREARREARLARQREQRQRRNRTADGPRTRIILDATEPFWVRRNDLRLELSSRLTVELMGGQPRLRGRVNVHRGRMDAEVGHYDIADGYIAFWGGGREPEMVLRGSFEGRRGRRRRVTIFGPLGASEVRFE